MNIRLGTNSEVMSDYDMASEHRKKRRRRELAPRPVHARLLFDEHLKSSGALLSAGLADALDISMCLSSTHSFILTRP